MKIKAISVISVLIWMVPILCSAQEDDLTTYTKTENILQQAGSLSGLEIDNRHGNISVNAWQKDSVRVDVKIAVNSDSRSSANEVLDLISIRSNETDSVFYFRTKFKDDFYSNHSFKISYQVNVPSNFNLKIKNRFGNIELSSITGFLDIDLEYGFLEQKGLGLVQNIKTHLSFADAKLGNFGQADMELTNAHIELENVEKGTFTGQYYQLDLPRGGTININSSTGRFNLGKIKELKMTGEFCYASINKILNNGHIEITNGLLIIKAVSDKLEELSVNNNNAPANISLPLNLDYSLHGEVTNGQFRHFSAGNFRIIRDLEKISFAGTNTDEQNGAQIVLFNKNASINIEKQSKKN